MKKLVFITILLLTFMVGCGGNTTTSSTVTTTTNSNTTTEIIYDYESVNYDDIREIEFSPSFEATFNEQTILYKTNSSLFCRYSNLGGYVVNTLDYFGYMYENLLEEEHTKLEYNDNNVFKVKSSEIVDDSFVSVVFKLQYSEGELIRTKCDNYEITRNSDSIELTLSKEENVIGYYFEIECAYIIKDYRGFMFYIGSMVLFN